MVEAALGGRIELRRRGVELRRRGVELRRRGVELRRGEARRRGEAGSTEAESG